MQQSRDFLEKAVKAQPESAEYHLLLAEVIFKGADTRAARREIDRALELAPEARRPGNSPATSTTARGS